MRERLPVLIPLACTVALLMTIGEPAQAAILAVATEGPVRVELHEEPGPCIAGARLAVWTDGKTKIPGCWRANPAAGRIAIAWLDGDGSDLDVRLFKQPEQL